MSRFLSLFVTLLIGMGLLLHFGVEMPRYLAWWGDLPGDLIIRKDTLTIYLPLASTFIVTFVFSFLFGLK